MSRQLFVNSVARRERINRLKERLMRSTLKEIKTRSRQIEISCRELRELSLTLKVMRVKQQNSRLDLRVLRRS